MRFAWLVGVPLAALLVASCSVYGSDLVGAGGDRTAASSSSSGGGGSGGTGGTSATSGGGSTSSSTTSASTSTSSTSSTSTSSTSTTSSTSSTSSSGAPDVLVISQVQTRGDNGGNDEFVEIYNPSSAPVLFDASWSLKARSAIGGVSSCTTNSLATRFTGGGQTIPAHGHVLFTNMTVPPYNGATASDGTYSIGIPDAASVVLQHNNTVVDALCFYFDSVTQGALTGCSAAYICNGTPAMNPHDNMPSTNEDASLERKPGGSGGNTQNTHDNATDFAVVSQDPIAHDLQSTPVP